MDHVKRLRPSPAMIVAIVALVLSLGGTSYAAIVLPAGSVGTTQLKKNAVVGSKVKNGSLTVADISTASLSKLGRVAIASRHASINAASRVAVVELTAPQAGFVLVHGWVNVDGLNGICTVRVFDDLAGKSSPYKNVIQSTGHEISGGNIGVFPVAAGERGFSVRVEDVPGALEVWATVTAQFIPYNGIGTKTAP
jgi:hypothetical protein